MPGERLVSSHAPTGFVIVVWVNRRLACTAKSGCIIQRKNLIG